MVERCVAVADPPRTAAAGRVRARAEAHLAPVVEREGVAGAGADQPHARHEHPRQMPFHAPPQGCRHSATSDEGTTDEPRCAGKPRLYKKARAKVSRTSRV